MIKGARTGAVVVLAIALAAVAAPVAIGHEIEFGSPHFYGDCTIGSDGGNAQTAHGFNYVRAARMKGARGLLTARALQPCTNGTKTFVSKSFVWAADLQGTGSNGVFQFVQLGIGKVRDASGVFESTCGTEWKNDQTYFMWTGFGAGTEGFVCPAAWVDFDSNGVVDTPVGGRQYLMSIQEWEGGAPTFKNLWRYAITDQVTGKTAITYQTRSSSDGGIKSAQSAWWGCEVGDNANAMGVRNGDGDVTVSKTAYLPASDPSAWVYTEDSPINPQWSGLPWYYTVNLSQAGLGESFSCRTLSHQ
jgi:hypothetical protein